MEEITFDTTHPVLYSVGYVFFKVYDSLRKLIDMDGESYSKPDA